MLPSKQKCYQYLLKKELAYPSLMILQDQISDYFTRLRGNNTSAFPNHACDHFWPNQEIIDVVFFGDALHAIAGAKTWPRTPKYRLWVLCHDMKNILNELVGVPKNKMGVIPRYEIFPQASDPSPLPSVESDMNFVMSSSYAMSKNIELTIAVVNELQNNCSGRIGLSICSPKPEEYIARDAISALKWKQEPIIRGDLGLDWQSQLPAGSVMINFSTNLFEDFGVSAAQAQSRGFPMIVSEWGAHKDLAGSNILKVPVDVFGHHVSKAQIGKRAKKTARYIVDSLKRPPKSYHIPENDLAPEISDINELLSLIGPFSEEKLEKSMELFRTSLYDPTNPIAKNIVKNFLP